MPAQLMTESGRKLLLMAMFAGLGIGCAISLTLWARTALASGVTSTPPVAVQLCANPGGVVSFAPSGTCPASTTAIAPVAQQSGVAELFTRVSSLESKLSA